MPPSTAIMVIAVVFIAMEGRVLMARYRALGRQQQRADSNLADRAEDEVRQLKERVAVLERVITDNHKSVDLDREIERLRDR